MAHMGDLVREKRMEKNWTVTRLERVSGVGRNAIYRLEREGGGHIETYEDLFMAMGYELKPVPIEMWKFSK